MVGAKAKLDCWLGFMGSIILLLLFSVEDSEFRKFWVAKRCNFFFFFFFDESKGVTFAKKFSNCNGDLSSPMFMLRSATTVRTHNNARKVLVEQDFEFNLPQVQICIKYISLSFDYKK